MYGSSSTTRIRAISSLLRQKDRKGTAHARRTLQAHLALVRAHNLLDDREADPRASDVLGLGGAAAHEFAEHLLLLAGRQTPAAVPHPDRHAIACVRHLGPHRLA